MNGNARTIERRIRVWVVQQERERRKQGQLAREAAARGAGAGEQRRQLVGLRQRKRWQ